jgi:hypothetical protein
LCGSFGWLLLCVATAKWLLQQMSPFRSFPCSTKGESQALSATFYISKPLTTFEGLLAFGPPSGAGRLRLTGFMACHVTSVADGQLLASARSSLSSFLKWGW